MAWSPPEDADPAEVVEQLARDILACFTQAEARLLADIARRARAGQDTPTWASEKAAAAREMRLAAARILAGLSGEEGRAAAEAVLAAHQAGAAHALAQLYDLGALDADQLDALHLRILRWAQDAFQTAIAAAAPGQLLGTATTHTAQRAAWDRLAADGVTRFVDKAGRSWNLASMDQLGVDLVTISRTTDGCALCAWWEGRILARDDEPGERVVDNELTGEPMTVEVAATVEEARAAGLMHPNCRHTFERTTVSGHPARDPWELFQTAMQDLFDRGDSQFTGILRSSARSTSATTPAS
ncbi:phage minor capsid protein [Saccharopolyspora cebuensis]|uniref:Phage minor capsid protein n=1 Tax=Saccharopolyspora cebuensis TaxID=418759 RepID=A0ABV4CMW9_9PSEU